MQGSFQNTMPATLRGIRSRENQPCSPRSMIKPRVWSSTSVNDGEQANQLSVLAGHVVEDFPVAVSRCMWSHEYSTEEEQKGFKELLI